MWIAISIGIVLLCLLDNFTGISNYATWTEEETTEQNITVQPLFTGVFFEQFSHISTCDKNLKTVSDFSLDTTGTAVYDVDVVSNDEDGVTLWITETSGMFNRGGSYFIVIQQQGLKWHRRVICPFTDHYNGTYSVYCSYFDTKYTDITVLVQAENFNHVIEGSTGSTGSSNLQGRNETLFSQRFYRPIEYTFKNMLHMLSHIIPISQPPLFAWRTDTQSQCTHLEHKGRIVDELSVERIQPCFQYYHDIIVVGEKDMENLSSELSDIIDTDPSKPPFVTFLEVHKTTDILQAVLEKLSHIRQIRNGKIALWIQIGSVHDDGLKHGLSTLLPNLIKTFKVVREYDDVDTRVLGPWPDDASTHSSSAHLGVLNAAVMSQVQDLSLNFTNVYEQAYPCLIGESLLIESERAEYISRLKRQVYQRGFLNKLCTEIEQTLHTLE